MLAGVVHCEACSSIICAEHAQVCKDCGRVFCYFKDDPNCCHAMHSHVGQAPTIELELARRGGA